MVKLSIIIPLYNVELYLEQCLLSIFTNANKSDITSFEVICVNDGSTDNSLQILKKFQKEYANVIIIDKENGGLSSARNAGIDSSRGEYITFIDSDDWYTEGAVNKIIGILKEYSDDIFAFHFNEYYGETSIIHHKESIIYGKFFLFQACWNKVFKKKLVDKIRFPIGLWYEDNEFTYKAIMHASTIRIDDFILLNYRKNRTDSIMNSQKSIRIFEINNIFENIYNEIGTLSLSCDELLQIEYIFFLNIVFRTIPKIIMLHPLRFFENKNLITNQFNLLDYYFHDWMNNTYLLEDVGDYFLDKIGRNHVKKILKIRRNYLHLFIYIILRKVKKKYEKTSSRFP